MNSLITVFFTCAVLCVSSVVAQSPEPRSAPIPDYQPAPYRNVSWASLPPPPPYQMHRRACPCRNVSKVWCQPSSSIGLGTCLSQIVQGILEIPVALLDLRVRTVNGLRTVPRNLILDVNRLPPKVNHESTPSTYQLPQPSRWTESSLSNPAGFRTRSLSHTAPFENSVARRNPQNLAASTPSQSTIPGAPLPSVPESDPRLKEGIEAYRDFRYGECLGILERYLARTRQSSPAYVEALVYAGAAAWMLKDDEIASRLFRKARGLNPNFQIDEGEFSPEVMDLFKDAHS